MPQARLVNQQGRQQQGAATEARRRHADSHRHGLPLRAGSAPGRAGTRRWPSHRRPAPRPSGASWASWPWPLESWRWAAPAWRLSRTASVLPASMGGPPGSFLAALLGALPQAQEVAPASASTLRPRPLCWAASGQHFHSPAGGARLLGARQGPGRAAAAALGHRLGGRHGGAAGDCRRGRASTTWSSWPHSCWAAWASAWTF